MDTGKEDDPSSARKKASDLDPTQIKKQIAAAEGQVKKVWRSRLFNLTGVLGEHCWHLIEQAAQQGVLLTATIEAILPLCLSRAALQDHVCMSAQGFAGG